MSFSNTIQTHWNALFHCPFHQSVALASTLALTTTYLLLPSSAPPRVIRSPRLLPPSTDPTHPYPADLLPGARYVPTPYGTVHATEFGPPDGHKVLLIHGISTPSAVFFKLAHTLADGGCRVLTFDLFGRGYSDAPLGVAYDERLYVSQALYALSSSPLHWDRYTVVGYSLGGGIAVSFAESFANRIENLILVAPAGILKKNSADILMRMSMAGYIPRAIENWFVNRRASTTPKRFEGKVWEEGEVDLPRLMKWQASTHDGFIHAFLWSFRQGPIYGRQEEWKRVGELGVRVGVVMAEKDDTIDLALLPEMVKLLGGPERVETKVLGGAGHELVNSHAEDVADFVLEMLESS